MGLCTGMMSALAVTASRLTSVMGFYIHTPSSLGNNPATKPRISTPVQDFSTGVNKFCALFSHPHTLFNSPPQSFFFPLHGKERCEQTRCFENVNVFYIIKFIFINIYIIN